MRELRLFTSESVTPGHPNMLRGQISDSTLDALIAQDRNADVAVETLVTTGLVHVAGKVSTTGYADILGIVRDRIHRTGYDSSEQGFDSSTCGVSVSVGKQSREIAGGVGVAVEARAGRDDPYDLQGAGDQGLMFGYAVRETPELMPIPFLLAHCLAERLTILRQDGSPPYLWPDGKTQVTVGYDGQRPVSVEAVVVSGSTPPGSSRGRSARTCSASWSTPCCRPPGSRCSTRASTSTRPAGVIRQVGLVEFHGQR